MTTSMKDLRKRRPGNRENIARIKAEMEREVHLQKLLDALAESVKATG